MTLKQLEAFYWAATCKNFAVAANRLNISISSLSKRVAELESVLGVQLFDRGARHAVITHLGDRLLPHARAVLTAADQFVQHAGAATHFAGRCRFGVGELSSLTWLPAFVDQIQRHYPALVVEPFASVGMEIEDSLSSGDLDFAVIAGPSTRAGLASQQIGQSGFTWVARPALLTRHAGLQAGQWDGAALICLPATSGVIRLLDEWLSTQHVLPERRLTCNTWGAAVGMIKHGLGVGFLPRAWAQALCERGELVTLSAFAPLTELRYTFQHRRDDTRPFLAAMRDLAAHTIDFNSSNVFA